LDQERVIIVSMESFVTLRQDLIQNLGFERMKGFLIRHGWELGVNDAKKVLSLNMSSLSEMVKKGPILHMMKGHVAVETTFLEIDTGELGPTISINMEGVWRNSYEAVGYLQRFSKSHEPVCHTLVGYVSGYLTTICNQKVIAKEIACIGQGDSVCRWVAKSIDLWGKEIKNELSYYEQTPIVQELEITYETLLEERNNLKRASTIHNRLTQELINGKDLASIVKLIYQMTQNPIVIEDTQFRLLAYNGVEEAEILDIQNDIQQHFANKLGQTFDSFNQVKKFSFSSHKRMMIPIFLKEHIYGYCSFLYIDQEMNNTSFDQMILERVSYVVAFYLLNKKTSVEAVERMKGHFLEEMLDGRYTLKKEVLKRGHLIHFDLEKPYHIVVLKYEIQFKTMKEELNFYEQLMEIISTYSQTQKLNILVGQRMGNIVLLVQSEHLNEQEVEKGCWEFQSYLSQQFSNASFYFGISLRANDILHVIEHYEEAVRALRMASPGLKVVTFQSLGILGALVNDNNISAIKKMAEMNLGSLIKCLDIKQQELLRTLYLYLFYGGNLEQTASKLAISISGLRYRIQKIEELLGHNLRNPGTNYQLLLSLQALILLGEIEI